MIKYLNNLENITFDLNHENKIILIIYDNFDPLSYGLLDMISNFDEIKNHNIIISNKSFLKNDMINKTNLSYFSKMHISEFYSIFKQINELTDLDVPYLYFFKNSILMYKTFYNNLYDKDFKMLKHIMLNYFNKNNSTNFNLLIDNYNNNDEIKIIKKEEFMKEFNDTIIIFNKTFIKEIKKIDQKNEYRLGNIKNIKVYI